MPEHVAPSSVAELPLAPPHLRARAPLTGVTILLVEDSRLASEAIRLLGLRGGARVRRADSLRSAERHLASYRPTVAIVDLGLPDGSGAELIRRLAAGVPRIPALFALSGDAGGRAEALAAGADAFLLKPVVDIASFEAAILDALKLAAPRAVRMPQPSIAPDQLAFREDLDMAAGLLETGCEPRVVAYAARFVAGVALSAGDDELAAAAGDLAETVQVGDVEPGMVAAFAALVRGRIAPGHAFV